MIKSTALFAKLSPGWARPSHPERRKLSPKARLYVESLEERALLSTIPVPVDNCRLEPYTPIHDLTNEHTDLDVNYSGGCLRLSENNKSVDPIEYYPAGRTILEFLPGAERPQTSDPRFDFIGAGAGNPVWIVPISPRDPNLLQLGVSGERIDSNTLMPYRETDHRINDVIPFPWIKLSVVDVRGPGYFSVWQNDDFGNPTIWVATSPGGNPDPNLFFTGPGGHIDYNWAFTAPGNYQVDIQASAFLADGTPIQSPVTTYHFQVDPTGDGPSGRSFSSKDSFAELASHFAAGTLKDLSQHTVQQTSFTFQTGQMGGMLQMRTVAPIDQVFLNQPQENVAPTSWSLQHALAGKENAGELSITGLDAYHLLDFQPF